ncbi:MAG: hypothetical protein GY851_32230, partial [bacterium]|nr:hypothetical protein [bacterium]
RAQEIAYGHAGFIGNAQTNNIQWVAKEHHMMTTVQRMVNLGNPLSILYEVDGELVTASVALAAGQHDRQRIEYDMATRVWVNWSPEPWEVEGRTLPQWGYMMVGPMSRAEFTVEDGVYSDYAMDDDYVFLDARTSFNMPYLNRVKDVEPKLAEFEYLGENRIRVTYNWIVNDTFDEDQNCFVHFINEDVSKTDQIVFQQDHGLPKPTSQWKPGDVIVDGPYEVAVPADKYDAYDLTIGLFKGPRVAMKGAPASSGRILLARLELDRDGDAITNIRLGDLGQAAAKYATPRADFDAHMNPEGTWVDRSTIATNGSVKVETDPSQLVVFPYPRDKTFDVALDVYPLARPEKKPTSFQVRALAAMTQEDMGEVPHTIEDGRVRFSVGKKGAGRYVVTWKDE